MSYDSRYPREGEYRDRSPPRQRARNNRDRDRDRDRGGGSRDGPASLPPRPPSPRGSSFRDRDRDRDSYRPSNAPPPPPPRDSYHWLDPQDQASGSRTSESHRMSDDYYLPPPPNRHSDRDTFRPPQGDFTFRVEPPPRIAESSYDGYRPGPRASDGRADRNYSSRDGPPSRQPGRSYGNQGYSGGYAGGRPDRSRFSGRGGRQGGQFRISDRPILRANHGGAPEQTFFGEQDGARFRALDELSDSEEADMDISEDEDAAAAAAAEPSQKRVRTGVTISASDNNVPKWSNPDPYTALAAPDPSQLQKKKDPVQLIRKARIQATDDAKAGVTAEAEAEFISFDSDDSEPEQNAVIPPRRPHPGVIGAPVGPRASLPAQPAKRTENFDATKSASRSTNGSYLNGADSAGKSNTAIQPRPAVVNVTAPTLPATQLPAAPVEPAKQSKKNKKASKADKPTTRPDLTPSTSLGSRKRTHDDQLKLPPHAVLKKVVRMASGGDIVMDWRARPGHDPCPWHVEDHSAEVSLGVRLHKEIVDFYDHVKPRDFEEALRHGIINDLKHVVRQCFKGAEVMPFGSFTSGLYLPTGDMDLVICSKSFINGGPAVYQKTRHLYSFSERMKQYRMAHDNDFEIVSHAKVPLVKFIDSRTGLKMDISFENRTGPQATTTFLAWKKLYPAMPILVTLIKQFLTMRGLNEPVNGGIGGFSVICLVVSMLQLMPQVQSRSMNTEHHLGDLLMEFFDLYGNRFNYQTTAIRLNPPGYVPKNEVPYVVYKNYDRFSIIDPNNPENDISGGSMNTATVVASFRTAHKQLQDQMRRIAQSPAKGNASILEVIMGGNYELFSSQREHMRRLAERTLDPDDYVPAEPEVHW